jgi:hypothetical protein
MFRRCSGDVCGQGDCNDPAGKRTFAAANGSVGGAAARKKDLFPGFPRLCRGKPGNSFIHGAGEARDTSALARVCQQDPAKSPMQRQSCGAAAPGAKRQSRKHHLNPFIRGEVRGSSAAENLSRCRAQASVTRAWFWSGGGRRSHEAAAIGHCDGLGPALHSELAEDVAQVGLDGVFGEVELCGDLAVGSTVCQLLQHLAFAR